MRGGQDKLKKALMNCYKIVDDYMRLHGLQACILGIDVAKKIQGLINPKAT